MVRSASNEVTDLLIALSNGNQLAYEKLAPLVYEELRRLAHRYMRRESAGHTLQTTALVNEAYLRLVRQKDAQWQNRTHFFAISAEMMRRILVDHARRRRYAKRGNGIREISLEDAAPVSSERPAEIVELDEALKRLAKLDPRKARVVELRFFGGLSADETAQVLKVHVNTVVRDWSMARAWLYKELKNKNSSTS